MLINLSVDALLAIEAALGLQATPDGYAGGGAAAAEKAAKERKIKIITAILDAELLVRWRAVLAVLNKPPPQGTGFDVQALGKATAESMASLLEMQDKTKRKREEENHALGIPGASGTASGPTEAMFAAVTARLPARAGQPLVHGVAQTPIPAGAGTIITLDTVNEANPAAPPPGAGSKGVLSGLTGHFKLLLFSALAAMAAPGAGGVGYDLGVRYSTGVFEFYPPLACNLGLATATLLGHHIHNKFELMVNAPVAPLSPRIRFLLTQQAEAFKGALQSAITEQGRLEGAALDTAAVLLFFAINALAAGRPSSG